MFYPIHFVRRFEFIPPVALACLLAVLGHAAPLWAQSSSAAIISDVTAQRHGLARAWRGQVVLDRSRDRLVNLVLDLPDGRDAEPPPKEKKAGDETEEKPKSEKSAGTSDLPAADNEPEKPRKLPAILFAQTDRGLLQAFDAETGQTLWSMQIGAPQPAEFAPVANDKYVAVINGSTLFIVERANGHAVWDKKLQRPPAEAATINQDYVLVPSISGHMTVFELAHPNRVPFNFQSFGSIDVQPTATLQSVAWATSRGFLYVATPGLTNIRFRFKAHGAVAAPLGYWPPHVLVASRDGDVYALNENSGETPWRFSTGNAIDHMPAAVDGHVYAIPQLGGMFSLSAETGEEEWWAPQITQFVAASPSRLYTADRRGRLIILDTASGGRVDSLPAENFPLKLLNTQTDRVYLATTSGFIQSFHEPELDQPYVHQLPDLHPEEPKAEAKAKDGSEGEEGAEEGEGGDNPFGDAGDDEEKKDEEAVGDDAEGEMKEDAEGEEKDEAEGEMKDEAKPDGEAKEDAEE